MDQECLTRCSGSHSNRIDILSELSNSNDADLYNKDFILIKTRAHHAHPAILKLWVWVFVFKEHSKDFDKRSFGVCYTYGFQKQELTVYNPIPFFHPE